jgi:riboflavin transporter FmnP
MQKNNRNKSVFYITRVACLSAIAIIVMFLEFTLPIFPGFYKLDFSTFPIIVGTFAMGPIAGVTIQFIKDLVHLLVSNQSMGIGLMADFAIGSAYILSAGIIYKRLHTKKGALLGCIAGTFAATIVGAFFNYYVLIPLYVLLTPYSLEDIISMGTKVTGSIKDLKTLIMFATVPFNLLKFGVISLLTMLTYKKVSPFFKMIRKESK